MSDRALNITALLLVAIHMALAVYGAVYVPIHWDEGWNLCVARVWADFGHYGCMINGEFTTARLSTGIIAVFWTKLGFDFFGIEYLSGRFFFLLHLLLFLIVFYYLGKLVFSKRVAVVALFILLLFADYRVSPALLTTQAHVEIMMYLYIALGYLGLFSLLNSSSHMKAFCSALLAALSFGLALNTKIQAEPFLWLAIAFVPLWLVYFKHYRHAFVTTLIVVLAYAFMNYSLHSLVPRQALPDISDGSGTEGLAALLGINPELSVRIIVFEYLAKFYWLHFVGIIYYLFFALKIKSEPIKDLPRSTVGHSIFIFVILWTGWFTLLSIDFPRYFSPPAVFGSLFSALFITHLGQWVINKGGIVKFLQSGGILFQKGAVCIVLTLLIFQALHSVRYASWYLNQDHEYNPTLIELAEYFNSKPDILIESYDSQLFYLLDVPFRYPPDQTNVDQIASYLGRLEGEFVYDYEQYGSDYLVIGEWSEKVFKPYLDINENPSYELESETDQFRVYRRVSTRSQ